MVRLRTGYAAIHQELSRPAPSQGWDNEGRIEGLTTVLRSPRVAVPTAVLSLAMLTIPLLPGKLHVDLTGHSASIVSLQQASTQQLRRHTPRPSDLTRASLLRQGHR
jgi:hypothetical protein